MTAMPDRAASIRLQYVFSRLSPVLSPRFCRQKETGKPCVKGFQDIGLAAGILTEYHKVKCGTRMANKPGLPPQAAVMAL